MSRLILLFHKMRGMLRAHVALPGLRLDLERLRERDQVGTFNVAAIAVRDIVDLDRIQDLFLCRTERTLCVVDVPLNDFREFYVGFLLTSTGFRQLCFSARKPSFGGLFSIEGLRLAVDNFALTFE